MTCLSRRPDRRSAASILSGRFVAPTTITPSDFQCSVEKLEQACDESAPVVVIALAAATTSAANGINFIDEDDTRCGFFVRLQKQPTCV